MKARKSERFVKMMTGPAGRGGRIVMGLVMLGLGQLVVGGTTGTVMTLASLVPISAGAFDYCLIAKALGYPLSGSAIRAQLRTGEWRQSSPRI